MPSSAVIHTSPQGASLRYVLRPLGSQRRAELFNRRTYNHDQRAIFFLKPRPTLARTGWIAYNSRQINEVIVGLVAIIFKFHLPALREKSGEYWLFASWLYGRHHDHGCGRLLLRGHWPQINNKKLGTFEQMNANDGPI
jgi:hypothetical protein